MGLSNLRVHFSPILFQLTPIPEPGRLDHSGQGHPAIRGRFPALTDVDDSLRYWPFGYLILESAWIPTQCPLFPAGSQRFGADRPAGPSQLLLGCGVLNSEA